MRGVTTAAKGLKNLIYENVYANKIEIKLDKAMFSFSFDDAPLSALVNGSRILSEAGVQGTFYVSLGLEGSLTDRSGRRYLDAVDISSAYSAGHDIGCHTYSHLDLRKTRLQDYVSDCEENTRQLASILGVKSVDHFAYPFGRVRLLAKKSLRHRYKTLRTIEHGINVGATDMSHLRTVSLCSNSFDRTAVSEVIQKNAEERGWVIFCSHDIEETPSEWGSSLDDLEWVVSQCMKEDAEILTVRDAYLRISENVVGHT
jgi:peptidoglycan/xylan/chitin deacetylase (PgdA/CDA1 family)